MKAIVLGVTGGMNFSLNDGTIVLFSSKYNLGRLEEVTDRYYNTDEDVFTTIEDELPPPTFPPARSPTTAPEPQEDCLPPNCTIIETSVSWIPPEEAVAQGLPGATTLPPGFFESADSSQTANSSQADIDSSLESPEVVEGADFSQTANSSQAEIDGNYNSNEASQQTVPMTGTGNHGSNQGSTGSYYSGSSGGSYSGSTGGSSNDSTKNQGSVSGGAFNSNWQTSQQSNSNLMRRRETIQVKLIWGVNSGGKKLNLWLTNSEGKQSGIENGDVSSSSVNLADPRMQLWLMDVVEMARSNQGLFVREDKVTWIERLRDYAIYAGVGWPIPERLFTTYLQLAKLKDDTFADLIENAIGTSAPGLGGDFTFASITMNVDAVLVRNAAKNISMSEHIYREWTEFAEQANELASPDVPDVVAQSSIFLDAYRVEATIDSTLMTWFVANGLCLLVILVFIQNLALSLMVMATILLILFCLGGLFFAVFRLPFGPVEALGVSIFIGLSANYSLHVVHAYHQSTGGTRESKIKEAIFAVGSPIIASALSTMGASAFLFACRTWVFIELGLLICSITGMALLYTMTFLLAWLSTSGPLPIVESGHEHLHQWDLRLILKPCLEARMNSTIGSTNDPSDDNQSVYSIEIVDLDKDSERYIEQLKMAKDDDNDSVYSIEVVDDPNDDVEKDSNDVLLMPSKPAEALDSSEEVVKCTAIDQSKGEFNC